MVVCTWRCIAISVKDEILQLSHVDLVGADFSGRKLPHTFSAHACVFTRCSFERMRVGEFVFGAGKEQTIYEECSFDGSRFKANVAGNTLLEGCSFRDVHIGPIGGDRMELVDCVFTGRLRRVILWAGIPGIGQMWDARELGRSSNRVEGNDFSGADLSDCGFRGGVDLTRNALPVGPGRMVVLDGKATLARVTRRVELMSQSELQAGAASWLKAYGTVLAGAQEHLWIQREDAPASARAAHEFVFDLFAELSDRSIRS